MSVPVKNPCFVAGTPLASGSLQDGAVYTTTGGGRAYTALSGVTADTLIFSGAGRLNAISVLNNIVSGQQVIFYDAAVATSGGPFAASGHKVVGTIPPVWHPAASGVINPAAAPGFVNNVNFPFQSGLCVANRASGTAGWSVAFTPETNTNFTGS